MRRIFEHAPVEFGYRDLSCDTQQSGRTYVTPEGKKYPSITSVLGILGKDSLAAWRQRIGPEEANRIGRIAATRGSKIHGLLEKYLNNEEVDVTNEMPHVQQNFFAAKKVLDEKLGKIVAQETPLYSDFLQVAGRVDLIAEFDGGLSIIDFKTSAKKKKRSYIEGYFMQECGYAIMFEERTKQPITQLVTIVIVDGQDEADVFIEHRNTWATKLLETITEFRRQKLYGFVK